MAKLDFLQSERVFYFFEQISAIPRGSGNMKGISQFCEGFALCHNLKYIRDNADNVVIFKNGTKGYEDSEPVILQGHLDMVCQKTPDCKIDFLKDGIDLYKQGDFIKARGTTLGGDNGIAVAMILAILESDDIPHPPIEAVFTTDEETGMIGAKCLDMSVLSGKRMINLDAEEDDTVTVSCAGGSDLQVCVPLTFTRKNGTEIVITLGGLKGGHSGVEINSGRINANILAGRILNHLKEKCDFDIISINGGDKANAIPNCCEIKLCVNDADAFKAQFCEYCNIVKNEISDRESGFDPQIEILASGEFAVLDRATRDKMIYILLCAPNGVLDMSTEIEGLVETSLNLGILETKENEIVLNFALRSNKQTALQFLEKRLIVFFGLLGFDSKTAGHYPPWEYKSDSKLRELYKKIYTELFGKSPKVEAIHAGLECGVFASAIEGIDCIAIGPALYDVHTVNEKLSISSTESMYGLLVNMLSEMK